MIKYCKKCVLPNTKPGVVIGEDGICSACKSNDYRKTIDWNKRWKELVKLCNKYRRDDGYYDCVIGVSGGKDSYYQIYIMKEVLGMNPLLVNVATYFGWTKAGLHNFNNMSDVFGCDVISINLNRDVARKMTRIAFEESCFGAMPLDLALYVVPLRVAINYNISLVVYGEDVSFMYGGVQNKDTYSAKEQIYNTVATPLDLKYWKSKGINEKDLNALKYPTKKDIDNAKLDPIYLSYFIPWDGRTNHKLAEKFGFKDLSNEWKRSGYIEDYDAIDTPGYLLNSWLKYPKLGFSRATDVACYWIWNGYIDRDTAVKLVLNNDHKLDQKILDDWLDFTGYTHKEFWTIVEKYWNRNIFERRKFSWERKKNILEALINGGKAE